MTVVFETVLDHSEVKEMYPTVYTSLFNVDVYVFDDDVNNVNYLIKIVFLVDYRIQIFFSSTKQINVLFGTA